MNEQLAEFEPPREGLIPVPDLAGTPAADVEGRFFGEVYGALTDAGSGLIRYLDVDVHEADRHVLVPIGHVKVAHTDERPAGVRMRAATASDLASIPPFLRDEAEDIGEQAILEAHGRFFSGEKYYAHPAYDHAGLYAGERPIVAHELDGGEALQFLSDLPNCEVAEGEPDIRGWTLLASDGSRAGQVTDLVIDPEALQVRYVAVLRQDERQVLLPVGFLQVDPDRRAVQTPALRPQDVHELPPHTGPVTRAQEEALRMALDRLLDGPRRFLRPDFRGPGRLR